MFERQRNMEQDAELGQGEPDWLRKAEKLVFEGNQEAAPEVEESVAAGVTLQSFEQLVGGEVISVSCSIDGVCAPEDGASEAGRG